MVAQLPPDFLRRWTPWAYLTGLILLLLVLTKGDVGQGARRWLDLGVRFQPSEAMKLAVQAGRLAFEAGRMASRAYASASSPAGGVVR